MEIIEVRLTRTQALAHAQFVKRVGWSEMRGCAIDDNEAAEIRSAVERVARALTEIGYAPR